MSRIWGGGAARRLLLSSCIVVLCLNASVAALPIASASNNRQGDGRIPPRPKFAALEERPDMIKVDLQSVARLVGLLKVAHEYHQMGNLLSILLQRCDTGRRERMHETQILCTFRRCTINSCLAILR